MPDRDAASTRLTVDERMKRGDSYFLALDLIGVLRVIADDSYVGNYSDEEVIDIYRTWATNALEGVAYVKP